VIVAASTYRTTGKFVGGDIGIGRRKEGLVTIYCRRGNLRTGGLPVFFTFPSAAPSFLVRFSYASISLSDCSIRRAAMRFNSSALIISSSGWNCIIFKVWALVRPLQIRMFGYKDLTSQDGGFRNSAISSRCSLQDRQFGSEQTGCNVTSDRCRDKWNFRQGSELSDVIAKVGSTNRSWKANWKLQSTSAVPPTISSSSRSTTSSASKPFGVCQTRSPRHSRNGFSHSF
jgi:hypothetical protein